MISCSIGVMAFNEEANIGHLLEALMRQRLVACAIKEIIVVASGCTDRTIQIVQALAESNAVVTLAVQKEREGKASAINLFLSRAKSDVMVVESADTIPHEDAIERLVRPFQDPKVGMTGAHPIPVNSRDTFMGFTSHLFWSLHHQVALRHPKLGELIAFRNIVREIPNTTAVDEASIEAIVTQAGYRIHYAADALVHNKGPETIRDFLKQRRRITAGHKHLKSTQNYQVSTMKIRNLTGLLALLLKETTLNPKTLLWAFGSVGLELWGRLLGTYDYYVKGINPFAWETARSTKKLRND
jgi:biofilm PGA synthesis N-glycosyltransferase PgaC